MAKDKRSRSRKPSGKGSQSASRDSSPPSSAPAPGASSDQEGKQQTKSIGDEGTLAEEEETSQENSTSQEQVVSQDSEAPVLADDGPLNSPQIEPALGAIVENTAKDKPVVDFQSPTNTEQSLRSPGDASEASPTLRRPSYNLAAELESRSMDSSEEDTQKAGLDQSIPRKETTGSGSEQGHPSESKGEATGSSDARSRQTRELQEETSQRIAAEVRVKTLEAQLKSQQQAFEDEARAEKRKHERAMQKANQAREADRVKFDEKSSEGDKKIQTFQAELAKYMENMSRMEHEMARSGNASADEAARARLESGQEELEMQNAITRELNPTVEAPPTSLRNYLRPGSARFLLAESEYLLDKFSPLYQALRAAANYVDGRGDWTSGDKRLFETFKGSLEDMNSRLEENTDDPQDCLMDARTEWGKIAQGNTW